MPLDAPASGALDQAAQQPSIGRPDSGSAANAPVSDRNSSAPGSCRFFRWFAARRYDPSAIRDTRFINQVTALISLKIFLLTEAVAIRAEDAPLFSFGALYQLRYSDDGRLPTLEEWKLLDERSVKLFSYLDEERKKRFQLKQAANLIAGLPILLLVAALISLMLATFAVDRNLLLLAYFFWTMCLGAIGAIAFLSVNALSIQNDVTFDWTNKSLLAVRIVLGALFGVVLSIPFGFDSFVAFCESIGRGAPSLGAENTVVNFSLQAALLLLPFILGFSTSLVFLVLNRFVQSIAVFFGDRRSSD
jgi:hypothetical protein